MAPAHLTLFPWKVLFQRSLLQFWCPLITHRAMLNFSLYKVFLVGVEVFFAWNIDFLWFDNKFQLFYANYILINFISRGWAKRVFSKTKPRVIILSLILSFLFGNKFRERREKCYQLFSSSRNNLFRQPRVVFPVLRLGLLLKHFAWRIGLSHSMQGFPLISL